MTTELFQDNFWRQTYEAWNKVQPTALKGTEILSQILWRNKLIKLESNPSINDRLCINRGLVRVEDVYDFGLRTLSSPEELHRQYGFGTFLLWRSVLLSIPSSWKEILAQEKPREAAPSATKEELLGVKKVAGWYYKKALKLSHVVESNKTKALLKWEEGLRLGADYDWCKSFQSMYESTTDFKIRWLQFRVFHRFLPTNRLLCFYKVLESPKCNRCDALVEDIAHIFWYCECVNRFWRELGSIFRCGTMFSLREVILADFMEARLVGERRKYLRICALWGKQYIWQCRRLKSITSIEGFKNYLAQYLQIERYIAINLGKTKSFNAKWNGFVANLGMQSPV